SYLCKYHKQMQGVYTYSTNITFSGTLTPNFYAVNERKDYINEWAGIGNTLDFGERMQDARIGRLNMSIDPLSRKFSWQSPYVFAGNSPIVHIDKDGEKREHFTEIFDERTGNTIIHKRTDDVLIRERIRVPDVMDKSDFVYNYNWYDKQIF